MGALLDELDSLPLIGGGNNIGRILSVLWQICEALYLFLRVQECRFTTPSQDAGM
jgi:hypothetical protein